MIGRDMSKYGFTFINLNTHINAMIESSISYLLSVTQFVKASRDMTVDKQKSRVGVQTCMIVYLHSIWQLRSKKITLSQHVNLAIRNSWPKFIYEQRFSFSIIVIFGSEVMIFQWIRKKKRVKGGLNEWI